MIWTREGSRMAGTDGGRLHGLVDEQTVQAALDAIDGALEQALTASTERQQRWQLNQLRGLLLTLGSSDLSLEEGLRRLVRLLQTRWLIGNPTGGCATVRTAAEADGRSPSGPMYPRKAHGCPFWAACRTVTLVRQATCLTPVTYKTVPTRDGLSPAEPRPTIPGRGSPAAGLPLPGVGMPFLVVRVAPSVPLRRGSRPLQPQQGAAIVRRGNAARVVGAFS